MSSTLEKLLAEDQASTKEQPKEETPAVEQPKNETPQQTEETPAEAVENKTEKVETPTQNESSLTETIQKSDDFDERFKTKLKEEGYISKEEFEEISNKPITKNELLQQLLEYDKKGVSIDKKTLSGLIEDFDSYDYKKSSDALTLMRRKLRKELGDDELVEFSIRKKYGAILEEDPDTDEYKEAMMSLQIDAKTSLAEFKAEQEKLSIPDPSQKSQDVEQAIKDFQQKEVAAQQERAEQIQQGFNKLAEVATKDFDKVNLKVLGEDVDIDVTSEQKKEVKKELKNLPTFFDRHFMKDGEVDQKGLAEFIHLALNKDKIVEIIGGNFKSKGQEEEFSSLKNQTSNTSTRSGDKPADDLYSQIAQQFAKENKTIW